jgi:flavin reductase (DIM6/NTAB) family NADH-FMN oxidoreductase RutF
MTTVEQLQSPHIGVDPKILYFGTPVVLVSTENEDGSFNLAPISSAWALGSCVVIGVGSESQTFENLRRSGECVLNLPSPDQWPAVERLAPLTGKFPVPDGKAAQFRFEREKFAAAGLTPVASERVRPPRVMQCPLQLEGQVRAIHTLSDAAVRACIMELQVLCTWAHADIVLGPNHIDPGAWSPLIYNFRHYFGLGTELGRTFRADTPQPCAATSARLHHPRAHQPQSIEEIRPCQLAPRDVTSP